MNRLRRVLVVDDEEDIASLVGKALAAAGYEIAYARDGEEGLSMALNHPPDAILLDVVMPKMDGWEVCRELRRHPQTSAIPVVILSALNPKDPESALRQSGATHLFVKPFRLKDVIAYLDRHTS